MDTDTDTRNTFDKDRDKEGWQDAQDAHDAQRVYDVPVLDEKATLPTGTFDPVYEAKARVLNRAIQDIGMGWYQWQLFVVVGFGWAADNMWPIVTSLILPPVALEFNVSRPPLLTLAQNIGLLVGAMFWGFGCDLFGRKWGFNLTLGITAVFGMISASSPTFAAVGTFAALWSFGVGGNLPVDSAVFLEFLPANKQWLLSVLSVGWAFAQVLAAGVAWPLIGTMTCSKGEPCTRKANMGWRYFVITMGAVALLMFVCRFFFFTIYESPKYLMGKGRDEDAVRVVQEVARRNGTTSSLTIDDLKACEPAGYEAQTDARAALKRKLESLDGKHVRQLFKTPKLAFSTTLLIVIWAFIGLAYPLYNAFLPYIQENNSRLKADMANQGDTTYTTYRNMLIIASLGVPGAIIGGLLTETRAGRRGVLGLATALVGVFLFASTTATTVNTLLAWNCMYNFFSSVMYAVLYAYTPELFPTASRGTGNALTASANRIFGVMAPIIGMFADLSTPVPVYVSGALFIVAGCLVFILPYESRGTAAL
ncbi:uncharacterized protein CcaverHIS019_0604170 [Cutaneotrichosporon cavernicola]|uniref:Major facilitator superfamily (MFS) profile domain-containing protein n=1 Tax=Cutaneotrichosporon cavernicola TaxID=279322 RepID=A0AA48L8R2_9TREE|nr:uncharacterized protein CcaverHIS019_0604170 [Cutaneotrichosporon cavernicola]BEI93958.1 hypothetical protein CcaverHIS019_0604170 [Cutaneotrichosporon cavernicola]